MAGSVNKVILVGNLGRDPELRQMPSGDPITNLRIATSESWNDRQTGERRERTEWHSVVIFGKLAEIANNYLRKGSKVYIEGQLQTRKWQDQTGNDRYSTEVVLRGFNATMVMLDSRGGGGGQPSSRYTQDRSESPGQNIGSNPSYGSGQDTHDSFDVDGPANGLDDEIPF